MNARDLFNKWVILGAILLTGFLLLVTAISIGLTAARPSSEAGLVPAGGTVLPAPTGTSGAPPTPPLHPFAPPTSPSGIAIGNYVQINGTEGQGLRIRKDPGLNGEFEFLAYDSEVFVVKEDRKSVV